MTLSQVRNKSKYLAVKELSCEKGYPIVTLCQILNVQRSAYYKWINRVPSMNEMFNKSLIKIIKQNYEEREGILGYRQMTIKINREENVVVNHKRVYRLMTILGIKSVCRKKRRTYIKSIPEITAENVLDRNFHAENICEKWLTDVTEMKYGSGDKAYLSAILDLGDKSIISFVIGRHNNNKLVFDTFELAREIYPKATPLFHSDRGYQYTSKVFRNKLEEANMIQSMSRIGRCIDNGPMEAFWGVLKSEMYNLKKFNSYESLVEAVTDYIYYYNNHRYQKRLGCMTPIEYRTYLTKRVA